MAQKVDQFSVICTRWLVGCARRIAGQERHPSGSPQLFLNSFSRQQEIGERTYRRSEEKCKKKEGLSQEEDEGQEGEGEDRTSLFLRKEEGFERVRSIVFCSVKRQTRLLHETEERKRKNKRDKCRRDEATRNETRVFIGVVAKAVRLAGAFILSSIYVYIQGVWVTVVVQVRRNNCSEENKAF